MRAKIVLQLLNQLIGNNELEDVRLKQGTDACVFVSLHYKNGQVISGWGYHLQTALEDLTQSLIKEANRHE